MPLSAGGVVAAALISYGQPGIRQAAAGSPYYGKAVAEAINGLKSPGTAAVPASRPPLPAGFSPAEYEWCETCKTYHKIPAGKAGAPAAAVPAIPAAVAPAAGTIPPLPAGLSPADYYWCADCKSYHARQPQQAAPAPAPVAGVPYLLAPLPMQQPGR